MQKNRWAYLNNPLGFKLPEKKPVIHPIITEWEQLPEDQKEVLNKVKTVVQALIGTCQISLFGSRVKGYWTDESDYDIFIFNKPNSTIKDILINSDYGAKVQIFFKDGEYVQTPGTILI